MSTPLLRHIVETPAGYVHALAAGPDPNHGTLVFFHQSPSSSRMWRRVVGIVAEVGIACLAPDMFDYGQSDRQTTQLTVANHAGLLLDACAAVAPGPMVLIGHHTGAVFAAEAARQSTDVRGLCVIGYPLYTTWREKLARLGARMAPDRFSEGGAEIVELWSALNRSIEPQTSLEDRQGIFIDRLAAGPLWYTAYAALMAADLEAPLAAVARSGLPLKTVWARQDAISRLEPGVTELTGVDPSWIEGGPWVTMEHPERVAESVLDFARQVL